MNIDKKIFADMLLQSAKQVDNIDITNIVDVSTIYEYCNNTSTVIYEIYCDYYRSTDNSINTASLYFRLSKSTSCVIELDTENKKHYTNYDSYTIEFLNELDIH